MKNNIRYKGNTNNTSAIIFFKSKIQNLPAMVLCLGEPPRWFLLYLHFIFDLHFAVVVLRLSMFFIYRCTSFTFTSRQHPSPFRGLSPGFFTHFILSAQPIAEWFATLSFSTIPWSCYCKRYGFERAFLTHRHFLPYAPSPTFFTQPAFFKAFLGAGSSSLKFAGLHTDPRNTGLAHLFVWFTVIHNLHIQNDSYLSSTIY